MTILLIGATGQVGRRVAAELANLDIKTRALVRDEKAANLPPQIELVRGDLNDRASLRAALDGVEVASLATAPTPGLPAQERRFIDTAVAAGLPRLVKLSAAGAQRVPRELVFAWHAESEAHLRASGIPATVLRPVPFASILLFEAPTIRAGRLHSPMGGTARDCWP